MKNGKTIILLHGWGLSADRYTPLIQELSRMGYSMYTPDLPGFGKTNMPKKPLYLCDYVEFVETYIKKHSIINPIIIGHSFGGRIAIKYASDCEHLLSGIILSGAPGYPSVKKWKWILSYLISKLANAVFFLPYIHDHEEKIRSWFYTIVGARDYSRASGTMRETFKNIVSEKLDGYIKQIYVPTLLFWGEEDIIVPVRVAERMSKTIANSKLVILPHGKHSVIIDEPQAFVKEVCSFL